ncbi:hemicentin-1-like [Gouania willdenowi]|uniref:hemicentin-1-like n=1 Tax=Gouania willdenowi TaxID=441366 RepID=UPI0010565948|nr:hemicentin-1-like [Gouania willdenowi]
MSKIFALIWIHLLCFLGCSTASSGFSGVESCVNDFCVTLSEHELRAEAGLCVVIPCTYSVPSTFTPQHIVWYKCNSWTERCYDSDIIFHSNKQNNKPKQAFIGRVSLLEPDMQKMNCSIMINDLTVSDTGSYQVKVIGRMSGKPESFISDQNNCESYRKSLQGLQQTPTLLIPTLTEGEQSTLTCVSPGLCSGSDPEITWIWSGPGEINSDNPGNNMEVTTFKQNSTLTFNSSAEHHGVNVTCRVKFTGNIITEKSSTVSVMYMKEVQIIGDKSVKEGDTLNLTCTVESFPPSQITWVKMQKGTKTDRPEDRLSDLQSNNETTLQEENESVMLFISNTTKEHSDDMSALLNILCCSDHRHPWVVGNPTVMKGDDVNLTCGAESFPPSSIIWTKGGSNLTLQSGQGSQSLVIPNVTVEDSGLYFCTVKYLNHTMELCAEVVVTWLSEIQNDSKCELNAAGLLTCVCISEGFPLPTITWPLLRGHEEHSVITTVSNYTVSSTVTLALKHHNKTSVECISSNDNVEARGNLSIQTKLSSKEDHSLLQLVSRPEVIIAFLIGVPLSVLVFVLAIIGYRRKKKTSKNSDWTVELSSHDNPQILGQHDEDEAVEAAGSQDSKDVNYATLDFSKIKKRSPQEAARYHESTKTEYAEIKKEVTGVREEESGDEEEMLEENEEEKMMEIRMEKETENGAPSEEVEATYCNVKEVIGEI